ncbi:hypothetical protein NLU13_9782 [Sarocladium strictum]|uniref:Xylanolytic transcriptional activator regulatory domain-containing protein n=1 Tax=Sarocladium strictum TaxID=5046 RepID=A0AA39G8Y0_SARSR|nr:hypothetical protein NLU13_9782 [Sarocladium strictum]
MSMFERDVILQPLDTPGSGQPSISGEIVLSAPVEACTGDSQTTQPPSLPNVSFSEEKHTAMNQVEDMVTNIPLSPPLPESVLTESFSYGLLWDIDTFFPTNSVAWSMDEDDIFPGSQSGTFHVNTHASEPLWDLATHVNSPREMIPPPATKGLGDAIRVRDTSIGRAELGSGTGEVSIPMLTTEDEQMAASDMFGYIHHIPTQAFRKITHYYFEQNTLAHKFVSQAVFQTFLELYFEYFAQELDFLHPSTIESDQVSWILLLAVAAVGSQYSILKQANQVSLALQELLQRAIKLELPSIPPPEDLTWAQTVLLRDICLFGNGGKRRLSLHQYQKYTLVTLCRAWGSIPCDNSLPIPLSNTPGCADREWRRWLKAECRTRLAHCVYHFESLQYMLMQLRHSMDLSELTNSKPSNPDVWKCRNASEWARQEPSDGDVFSRKVQYIFVCVEEKLTLERLLKLPLRFPFPHDGRPRNRQRQESQSSHGTPGDVGFIRRLVSRSADTRLRSLYPQLAGEAFELESSAATDVIFPLFALLRQISLNTLHAISGWQASEEQIQVARATFSSWMKNEPAVARTCLRHAVVIFSTLRSKTHFGHYDALSLLVGALYIWAYDQLVENETKDAQQSQILRLDKHSSEETTANWVHDVKSTYIHIPGIGILDGCTSPLRTLWELKRVLLSRTGWRELRVALATLVGHLIQGQRPKLV